MDPKLRIVSMAFEERELRLICARFGVEMEGKTSSEVNEALKIAISSLSGFMPLSNKQRRNSRRVAKAVERAERLAREESERDEARFNLSKIPRTRAPQAEAPRAAQAAPVAPVAPVAQAPRAQATQPPRATAPQPIAVRAQPARVAVEEPAALPIIPEVNHTEPSAVANFLASDDEDWAEDQAELWEELRGLVNEIKLSENGHRIAKAQSTITRLGISQSTISTAKLQSFKNTMEETA